MAKNQIKKTRIELPALGLVQLRKQLIDQASQIHWNNCQRTADIMIAEAKKLEEYVLRVK